MKKQVKTLKLISSLALSFALVATAQTKPEPEGLTLVKKALQSEEESTSLSKTEIRKKGKTGTKITIHKKYTPDGFLLHRIEMSLNGPRTPLTERFDQTVILNQKGQWLITRGKAISMNFAKSREDAAKVINPETEGPSINAANKYETKSVLYNGKEMIEVKITLERRVYEEKLKARQALIDFNHAENEKAREYINEQAGKKMEFTKTRAEDVEPFIYECVIEPDTNLIWSYKTFAATGTQINSSEFTEITTNQPLADDLFELPAKTKVKTADSMGDYLRIIKENDSL